MNEQAKALIDFIILQYLERNTGLNIISKEGRLYNESCTGKTKEGGKDNITPQQIIDKIKDKFPNSITDDDKKRLSLLPYLFTIGNGRRKIMVNTLVNFYPVADLGFVYVDLYSMFFGSDQLDSKIIRRDGTLNYLQMSHVYTMFARKGSLNSIYDLYNTESLDTCEFLIPLIATEKAILSINLTYNMEIFALEIDELTGYSIDVTPLRYIYDAYSETMQTTQINIDSNKHEIVEKIMDGIRERSFVFKPVPIPIKIVKFKE